MSISCVRSMLSCTASIPPGFELGLVLETGQSVLPIAFQVEAQFSQSIRHGAVVALRALLPDANQAAFAQNAQVKGDRGLRHVEGVHERVDRKLGFPDVSQDLDERA